MFGLDVCYIFCDICSYRELTVYNAGINDFKSLRFKLLCKSYLILMDVFTYHQVQVGTDLDLCSSFFGANL